MEKEYAIHLGGAFPPLAKPYSPYETELAAGANYASNKQELSYDPALQAFVLPEFTKWRIGNGKMLTLASLCSTYL